MLKINNDYVNNFTTLRLVEAYCNELVKRNPMITHNLNYNYLYRIIEISKAILGSYMSKDIDFDLFAGGLIERNIYRQLINCFLSFLGLHLDEDFILVLKACANENVTLPEKYRKHLYRGRFTVISLCNILTEKINEEGDCFGVLPMFEFLIQGNREGNPYGHNFYSIPIMTHGDRAVKEQEIRKVIEGIELILTKSMQVFSTMAGKSLGMDTRRYCAICISPTTVCNPNYCLDYFCKRAITYVQSEAFFQVLDPIPYPQWNPYVFY